ncbi:tetratricopeptide repeat protein [Reichenbachiella sp.]|uniref:tetratricopeptide repeat protein n=1 Tax=Reichenbachiella sp. TaxID=2184521 RepID=UPI003B5A073C
MDHQQQINEYNNQAKRLLQNPYDRLILLSLVKLAPLVNEIENTLTNLKVYLKKYPEDSLIWMAVGQLYLKVSQTQKALKCFLKCGQLNPEIKGLWLTIADCYYHLKVYEKVEENLKVGLKMHPNQPVLVNRLAFLYKQLGRIKASAKLYRQLIKFPEFAASAHFQLATILQELNMPRKSIAHYEELLKLEPDHADGYYGLGIAYAFMQDFESAIKNYQKALECDSGHLQSRMELSSARASICDWSSYLQDRVGFEQALSQITMSGDISLTRASFDINYFDLPPNIHKETATKCAKQIEKQLKDKRLAEWPIRKINAKNKKLKVGYLSPDFREHAVGRLIYEIFEFHNKERFETFAYATIVTEEVDFVSQAIQENCDHFINCHHLTAVEIAKKIRADEIDVLIDLVGYTTYSKPAVVALKPAVIQMHYLGNPGTMGAEFTPYFLSDSEMVPEKHQKLYTEEILYLKHGWVASKIPDEIPNLTKADCNLPENALVYCSFNFPKKLSPEVFNVWMKILIEVQNSVLWIYAPLELQQENLMKEVSKFEVDKDRIIFADNVSYTEYLARLKLADIFLDSFFYGAGSTAANALMMGVPVLTLPGETFVSRLGSGVNAAASMKDWNCSNETEYLEKAVYWATHKAELFRLKKKLPLKVKESPLCDVKGFVSGLEQKIEKLVSSIQ